MIDAAHTRKSKSEALARTGLALLLTATMSWGIGCSGSDTDTPEETTAQTETQPSMDQTADDTSNPQWIQASQSWPDTLRYSFDSTLEVMQDGFMLRLRPSAIVDVSHTMYEDEQPLRCAVLMTIRPVPEWTLARGLVLDSVVFHDPDSDRDLRSLPMLSFERTSDKQTVRTLFQNNLGDAYRQSSDLPEGHVLVPTIYLSWDGRIIIASMPPITLSHSEK